MLALAVLAVMALLILVLKPVESPFSGRAYAIDGDTMKIGSERVRLLGIDAPELEQTCTGADGALWACGRDARHLLVSAIAGAAVDCTPGGRDRYGRVLAHCSVDGSDLGAIMVGAGLAVAEIDYVVAELAARGAGKGIWAGRFDTPKAWREAHGLH